MAIRKSKKDYVNSAIEVGLGIGGGFVGNMGTTWLEKQSFMGTFAPYSSAIVSLLGIAGYVLAPDPKIKAFALGMAVIGGTETSEMLMSSVTTSTTSTVAGLGYSDKQLGLGFTPKPLPVQDRPFTVGGVAIR